MIGINPIVASHKLNIIPTAKPVRHKVRRFHSVRHKQLAEGRFYQRSEVPQMASQRGGGSK